MSELDSDAQQYLKLAEDLGDKTEAPAEAPKAEEPKPEEPKVEAKAEEPKPEPLPYEELERRHKNLNGALGEARAEQRQLRERVQQMEAVFQRITAERQKAAVDEQFADPVERKVYEIESKTQELARAQENWQKQQQTAAVREFVLNNVSAAEESFAAKAPDYYDATKHLQEGRARELAYMYPDDDPSVIQAARERGFAHPEQLRRSLLADEAIAIAQTAMRAGRDPAQMFYDLAVTRGWTKPAPAQPAAHVPPQRIESIRKAQESAPASLSNGASKAASNVDQGLPSIEELADMYLSDPRAADAAFRKMKQAGLLG